MIESFPSGYIGVRGQGYDGASSMAGQRAGAAARFEVEAPDAHYYHCAMHCLNLSAAKAITVQSIKQAQDVIKDITSCFRSSAKRTDLLKSCIYDEEDTRISKTQLVTSGVATGGQGGAVAPPTDSKFGYTLIISL